MPDPTDGDPTRRVNEPTDLHIAAGETAIAAVTADHELLPSVDSPNERIAQGVCREILQAVPGYQGTFSFGTPGGNDLDLRLCFQEDLDESQQEDVRTQLLERLHTAGVDVEVDLLFMSGKEFADGIRDLVELGDVAERLRDGFDPHEQQAAVGDTSMFSLYIFSTMRMLHRNPDAASFGSPEEALNGLVLSRDGAVGWMHFYTGCFLHEYLGQSGELVQPDDPGVAAKYQERLAKFTSRVVSGNTLARVEPEAELTNELKPKLIEAIQTSDADNSTDAKMTEVLLGNRHTSPLLDEGSQNILRAAGQIRSGNLAGVRLDFVSAAEAELFYRAFEQGIDRRGEEGENADPLTSYALGELVRSLGRRVIYEPGATLMSQGEPGTEVIYIPLKTQDRRDNTGVDVIVAEADGRQVADYERTPGRVVGEGAIFGLPRSATVTARGEVEAYAIDVEDVRDLLTDPATHAQLSQPDLHTQDARRVDVLLRYFAREAAIFTRQTLPYTSLGSREAAEHELGVNPLADHNLRGRFQGVLRQLAESEAYPQVTTVVAESERSRTLFETGQSNDKLYVVAEGAVEIPLQNGEVITLQPGEYFGESSLLGMETTGSAILTAGSRVVAADAQWFKRFTQSRQPIRNVDLPEELQDTLPVHLLYHLAAEGYDRVRRRLTTQAR